jgi:hypothetical protein
MQVEFRSAGGVPGVPMRLLQDAGSVDLPIEGADNIPFSESVASTITLRIWVRLHSFCHPRFSRFSAIQWPGYVQYSRRMTMRKATGLLMRRELAMAVAEVFKQFIEVSSIDSTT